MKTVQIEIKYGGQLIGSCDMLIDETFITPVCDCSDKVMYLSPLEFDYIQLETAVVCAGEFDFKITTQGAKEVNSCIPLFGDLSVGNRLLITPSTGVAVLNIGGSYFQVTGLNVDYIKKTETRLYRNALNEIYLQIDGDAPILITTSANTFTLSRVARSSSGGNGKNYKGYVWNFTVNGEYYNCSEGIGNILTGDSSSTAEIKTNSLLTNYFDDYVWTTPEPEGQAIQVYNEGVPNNNSYDLTQRTSDVTQHSPDLCIIMIGANDGLNTSQIQTPAQLNTNLTAICNALIGSMNVILAYTPPCIDSYKKDQNDYTPIYGDESTYNLNEKLDLLRAEMDNVANTINGVTVIDTSSNLIADLTVNSDIRNALNAGGQLDGVHPTSIGQEKIADSLVTACAGYSKIVCFGDSITYGVGATSYAVYLSQKLNA